MTGGPGEDRIRTVPRMRRRAANRAGDRAWERNLERARGVTEAKTEAGIRRFFFRTGRRTGSAETRVLALFFAALLAMRLYFIFAYPFDSDESQHLHVAWGWTQGLLQYRDVFDNHMPLFHLMMAPLVALIGADPRILFPMRLAMLPMYAATLWGAYRLGRALFGKRAGAWGALLLGLTPAFFYNSLEFRTDDLWTALLTLAWAALLGGRWTAARAFGAGLLLGSALGVSLKTLMFLPALALAGLALPLAVKREALPSLPGRPWRGAAAFAAGICAPSIAVILFFASRKALGPFYYGVVGHNMVPGFEPWRRPLPFLAFPVILAAWILAVRALAKRVHPAGGAARLAFLLLMGGTSWLLDELIWPVATAPTRLPLFPPTIVLLTGLLLEAWKRIAGRLEMDRPGRSVPATGLLAAAALAGFLLVPPTEPGGRRPNGEQIAMVAEVLRLTDGSDFVMDLKGETMFRRRAFYYVLEPLTMKRLAQGSIPDRIKDDCVASRAGVAVGELRHYPPEARRFLAESYLEAGPVRVAGRLFPAVPAGEKEAVLFDIAIPGRYALVAEEGIAGGTLDGEPWSGPRYLRAGRHEFAAADGAGPLALVWARAAEGGFSPFGPAGRPSSPPRPPVAGEPGRSLRNGAEGNLPEDFGEPVRKPAETGVVDEAEDRRQRDARRIGIELPGMQVHEGGDSPGGQEIDVTEDQIEIQEPHGPPPADHHASNPEIAGENRILVHRRPVGADDVRLPREIAAADERAGSHAGVVRVAAPGQDWKGPQGSPPQRPAGRPVAPGPPARDRAEDPLGLLEVLLELGRREPVDPPVGVTVGGDGVALVLHPEDQAGMSLRHPPEDEEGGTDPVARQDPQKEVDVLFHPGGKALPPRLGDELFPDVEPLLQVDGQEMLGDGQCVTGFRRGAGARAELPGPSRPDGKGPLLLPGPDPRIEAAPVGWQRN